VRTIGNEMSFSDCEINNTDEKVDENCIEISVAYSHRIQDLRLRESGVILIVDFYTL